MRQMKIEDVDFKNECIVIDGQRWLIDADKSGGRDVVIFQFVDKKRIEKIINWGTTVSVMFFRETLTQDVQRLFEAWAPEYVLTALREEFKRRHDLYKRTNLAYAEAAGGMQRSLVAFCRHLPGYQDEITKLKDIMDFEPRW